MSGDRRPVSRRHLLATGAAAFLAGCSSGDSGGNGSSPTPPEEPTPIETVTQTPTQTPTDTPTQTPTETPEEPSYSLEANVERRMNAWKNMTYHELFSHNYITDWKLLRQLGFSPEISNSYWDFMDFDNVEARAYIINNNQNEQEFRHVDNRSVYILEDEPDFVMEELEELEFILEHRSVPIYDIGGRRKAFYHPERNVVAGSETPHVEDVKEMIKFFEGDDISAYEGYDIADIDGLDENLMVSTSYDGILIEGILGERSFTGAAEETREVVSYNVDPEEENLKEEVRSRPKDVEGWEVVNSLPRNYSILNDVY